MKTKFAIALAALLAVSAVPANAQDAPTQNLTARTFSSSNQTQEPLTAARARLSNDARAALNSTSPSHGRNSLIYDLSQRAAQQPNRTASPFAVAQLPRTTEADREISELTEKIRRAENEEEKLQHKEKVKELLEKQYDEYLNFHEQPLIELEERLAKLREDLRSVNPQSRIS